MDAHRNTLTFVGTATTILRLGPFTLLTDPNFLHRGQYAHLGYGIVTRRRSEPALGVDELPDLDAVVLSHLHGDHFDRVARRGLDRDLPILTTQAAARRLSRWGFGEAVGMSTWGTQEIDRDGWRLRVTSVPGVHGPGLLRHLLPPVMGAVLELSRDGEHRLRVYISGDTLVRPWLTEVVHRMGPLDAAVLHLGGTRIAGFTVTMTANDGARLGTMLRPRTAVPVHMDDYGVFHTTPVEAANAWRATGAPGDLRLVDRGGTVSLDPA